MGSVTELNNRVIYAYMHVKNRIIDMSVTLDYFHKIKWVEF